MRINLLVSGILSAKLAVFDIDGTHAEGNRIATAPATPKQDPPEAVTET